MATGDERRAAPWHLRLGTVDSLMDRRRGAEQRYASTKALD
eukprot:COSAG04_NODE_28496_length_275_cov_0.698864_1_plen_40_part_01